MNTNETRQRQREDGTSTFTTVDWDAKYYWPVGARVIYRGFVGTVVKENPTTVSVMFDDHNPGHVYDRVPMSALYRVDGGR
jgi:hypothetical protein